QENGRVAFELMARQIREAGGTPCGKNIPIANVLKDTSVFDYSWGDGIRGYDGAQAIASAPFGTAAGQRVQGTDAFEFRGGENSGISVTRHNPASATIFTNTTEHGFVAGDILLICDYSQATIFQMSGPNAGGTLQVVHNTGTGTPGNDCKALSFPVDPDCSTKPKDGKQYADNAVITKLTSAVWYIGNNGRGGRSLYRRNLTLAPEEVTEGIQDMQLTYLVPGTSGYVPAASVATTSWREVNAVRIDLDLIAVAGVQTANEIRGTDGLALTRPLSHVVTLRNRTP
ncbi:PilW family protein, partial [Arenimonas metalli]